MFSLGETTTWTAEDARVRLQHSIPATWKLSYRVEEGWHLASLVDQGGDLVWSGENADQKILFLDALGWLRLRKHQPSNPMWRPRGQEVPLHRPAVEDKYPDPLDLDPEEVAAVYKTSR